MVKAYHRHPLPSNSGWDGESLKLSMSWVSGILRIIQYFDESCVSYNKLSRGEIYVEWEWARLGSYLLTTNFFSALKPFYSNRVPTMPTPPTLMKDRFSFPTT